MGGKDVCSVINCRSSRRNIKKEGGSMCFFSFPWGKSLKARNRRKLWVEAIRRKNFVPTANSRVCGLHFLSGLSINDPNSVDFVPTLKLGYEKTRRSNSNRTHYLSDDEIASFLDYNSKRQICGLSVPELGAEVTLGDVSEPADVPLLQAENDEMDTGHSCKRLPDVKVERASPGKTKADVPSLQSENDEIYTDHFYCKSLPDVKVERPIIHKAKDQSDGRDADSGLTFSDARTRDMDVSGSSDDSRSCKGNMSESRASSSRNTSNVASAIQKLVGGARVSRHLHTSSAVDKPYFCQLCAGEFIHFRSLVVHTAHVHGVNVQLSTVNTCLIGVDSRTDVSQEKTTDISGQGVLTDSAQTVKRETLDSHTDSAQTVKRETLDSHTDSAQTVKRETLDSHTDSAQTVKRETLDSHKDSAQTVNRETLDSHTDSAQTVNRETLDSHTDSAQTVNRETLDSHTDSAQTVNRETLDSHTDSAQTVNRKTLDALTYYAQTIGGSIVLFRKDLLKELSLVHCNSNSKLSKNDLKQPSSKLTTYELTHTEEGPYVCKVCGKTLKTSVTLRVHERTHTGNKPYLCAVCGKAFFQSCTLRVHERIHSGEKPYVCTVCGKTFSTSAYMRLHERCHTGEKPHVCKVCGKAFTFSSPLRLHERRDHSRERPHVCKVCGKAFVGSAGLQQHESVHTGYKPYVCKVCGKACDRLANLRKHELIHTGEKPYVCQFCGKGHNQSSNLKKHEIIHTRDKP